MVMVYRAKELYCTPAVVSSQASHDEKNIIDSVLNIVIQYAHNSEAMPMHTQLTENERAWLADLIETALLTGTYAYTLAPNEIVHLARKLQIDLTDLITKLERG